MLSKTARGLPRFSMTSDLPSSSTRRRSLPKLVRASKAVTTMLLLINSPFKLSQLYSSSLTLHSEEQQDIPRASVARRSFGFLGIQASTQNGTSSSKIGSRWPPHSSGRVLLLPFTSRIKELDPVDVNKIPVIHSAPFSCPPRTQCARAPSNK